MPRKNKKATVEPVETNAPPTTTTQQQSSNPNLTKRPSLKKEAATAAPPSTTVPPNASPRRRRGGAATTIGPTFLSLEESSFIPISVRKEIQLTSNLPNAPSSIMIEGALLLVDICGFTRLGEVLIREHGQITGSEMFAAQISEAISALSLIVFRFNGTIEKIAGDCLICFFADVNEEDDGVCVCLGLATQCATSLLAAVSQINSELDVHGAIHHGFMQRIHMEVNATDEQHGTQTTTRWYAIAGRALKVAGSLLTNAKRGEFRVFGGNVINKTTKETSAAKETLGSQDASFHRSLSISQRVVQCPSIAQIYLPPIYLAKYRPGGSVVGLFTNEYRRVVTAFISLPGLFALSIEPHGINVEHLNEVYTILVNLLSKHEGLMRDFLFEEKGCTMICCWGCVSMSDFDVIRGVLFALETLDVFKSLGERIKIGISSGDCFTGVCGHLFRRDYVVMGTCKWC